MTMTFAQLWQIVADAKNDLHVVEQELAKLIDEEEKRQDDLPVYENFLPVGTYLLSEEEHRKAPVGTLILEKNLHTGRESALRWEKVGHNRWLNPAATHSMMTLRDADMCHCGPDYVNMVVDS